MNKNVLKEVKESNDRQLQEMIAYHAKLSENHLSTIRTHTAIFLVIAIVSIVISLIAF